MIQYNCIPHYRQRLFSDLSSSPDCKFTIVADSEPDTPFLKVVPASHESGIRAVRVHTRVINIPFLPALYWQPGALRYVFDHRPNIIVALGSPYSLTGWALCLIGKVLGIPVLLWTHGLLEEEHGLRWWMRSVFYRLAHALALYGDQAKQLLLKRGFRQDRLHVVYNSLDYDTQSRIDSEISDEERTSFREMLKVGQHERLVVFTGRLQAVKRLDLLIGAISLLKLRGRVVHAALVGHGTEREMLEELAEELNVAHLIHFFGETYDERVLGLVLGAGDLCVIPSGAGLSVMHALTFGTPVLLHDSFGQHGPEWEAVQDGATGAFYKDGDMRDLALKMEQHLFPTSSKEWMASACRAVIRERYNPSAQAVSFVTMVRLSNQQKLGICS
jgi:glycosyltransferase involved in cell wall biosynthesis